MQLASQPDGLRGQVGAVQGGARAGRVALVEDQVQDVQHGPDPFRTLLRRRHRELRAAGLDPLFGPADPLRDGRLRHQERPGDLGGAQAADRAERQRHLGRPGQRRVAAEQEQGQGVVDRRHRPRVGRGHPDGVLLPPLPGGVAAPHLGAPAGGDRDQPALRVVREPFRRPLCRGGEQGLLDGVLAGVEAAVPAHQRAEHLRGQPAQQGLDVHTSDPPPSSRIGRTSTSPHSASGNCPAISTARSGLSTSTR